MIKRCFYLCVLINIAVCIYAKLMGFIKLGYRTILIKTDMLSPLEKLCMLEMATGYLLNKRVAKTCHLNY